MAKIKLGKLPGRKTVKMTFAASVQLKNLLEKYATSYEKSYGVREKVEDIIPYMLETFIENDRGFKKSRQVEATERNETSIPEVERSLI